MVLGAPTKSHLQLFSKFSLLAPSLPPPHAAAPCFSLSKGCFSHRTSCKLNWIVLLQVMVRVFRESHQPCVDFHNSHALQASHLIWRAEVLHCKCTVKLRCLQKRQVCSFRKQLLTCIILFSLPATRLQHSFSNCNYHGKSLPNAADVRPQYTLAVFHSSLTLNDKQ